MPNMRRPRTATPSLRSEFVPCAKHEARIHRPPPSPPSTADHDSALAPYSLPETTSTIGITIMALEFVLLAKHRAGVCRCDILGNILRFHICSRGGSGLAAVSPSKLLQWRDIAPPHSSVAGVAIQRLRGSSPPSIAGFLVRTARGSFEQC